MKLELKHLAPYLPYNLQCKWNKSKPFTLVGLQNGNESVNNELWTWKDGSKYLTVYLYECKPILRPMEDIKYYVEFLNKYNVDFDKKEGCLVKRKNDNYTRLNELDFLFENHFDVFGLIPKGLAIDINTLNQ